MTDSRVRSHGWLGGDGSCGQLGMTGSAACTQPASMNTWPKHASGFDFSPSSMMYGRRVGIGAITHNSEGKLALAFRKECLATSRID